MGKSESKEHHGFEALDTVQKDLKACLRADPTFDAKRTLKCLVEGIKSLRDAVEMASKEKEKLEQQVKEVTAEMACRQKQIAQSEEENLLLREAVARCQEQIKQAEQERDAALRSVAERDREIEELEVRSRPTNRFKGLARNNPELGMLFEGIETSGEAFKDLQDLPSSVCEAKAAAESEVIQDIRKEVNDIENDRADRESLRRDLTSKKPLQALKDLVAQFQPLQENNSDIGIGKVVGTLVRDVQTILQKYDGDRALCPEDAKIRGLISTYIHGTIYKLQEQRESSRSLLVEKDGEEARLAGKIRELTDKLNQIACPDKSTVEKERISRVYELAQYYVDRVKSVMSEDKAAKLLEEKRTAFCLSAAETRGEYETMQKIQDDCIKDLQRRHENLCALAVRCDVEHKKEERLYKWVAMATRLLQRHHVVRVSESLATLLQTVAGLSNASAIREHRRIACKEAESLCLAAEPRLLDAARMHGKGKERLLEAADLIEQFEHCVLGAFDGLTDKVKQDRRDLETNQPMYGAKWLVADRQLRLDITSMQETVTRLCNKVSEDRDKLSEEVEFLQYSGDGDGEFDAKFSQLKAVEAKAEKLETDLDWLQQTEQQADADNANGNPAALVAREAPQSLLEQAQRWFFQYHPAPGPQHRRNLRGRAALEGGQARSAASKQPLQLQDGQAGTRATASIVATLAATTKTEESTRSNQGPCPVVNEESPRHCQRHEGTVAATVAVASAIAASTAEGGEGDGMPASATPAAPSPSEDKVQPVHEEDVVEEKACATAVASAKAEEEEVVEEDIVEEKACATPVASAKAEEEEVAEEPAATPQEADETCLGDGAVEDGVLLFDAEEEACPAASEVADVMEAEDEEQEVDCVINLSSEHDNDFIDVQLMSS